jgi:thioredoxin-like negative regulator of GroEL
MLENLLCSIKGGKSADAEASQEDSEPPSTSTPSIIQVDDQTFAEAILASPQPALVQFWAPWSGSSRQVSSMVASLANEFQGRVLVAQLNADENPGLLDRLRVSRVPTLILFKEGQEAMRVVGEAPKGSLRSKLGGLL